MKKKPLIALIGLLALLFTLWEGWEIAHGLQGPHTPEADVHLRELTLPDLKQHPQSLRQWDGRVLVVNFWATWCEPCKEEIPLLNHVQQDLGEQQVQFVGIGVDEPAALLDFVQHQPFSYPVLSGSDQTLALTRSLGNSQQGIPFTVVFDPRGRAVLQKLGRVEERELRQAIALALRESAP